MAEIAFMNKKYKSETHPKYIFCNFRAGPGVKNFVRERRRESCRERGMASKRKSLFTKKIRQENLGQYVQMIFFKGLFETNR